MHQRLLFHTLIDPSLAHQIYSAGFQHPCANTAQHMLFGLALQHDGFYTLTLQKLTEQHARGTTTNYDNTCFSNHCSREIDSFKWRESLV